jgi:tRNA A37 threonylcarbamoyladenosine modification protein TsaB
MNTSFLKKHNQPNMFILIDNSLDGKIEIHAKLDTKVIQHSFMSAEHSVVSAIKHFLSKAGIGLLQLKGIAVVVGKGKFTSTRIATTVANVLSYVFKIPVIEAENTLDGWWNKFAGMEHGKYISAKYSGEPRIGGDK